MFLFEHTEPLNDIFFLFIKINLHLHIFCLLIFISCLFSLFSQSDVTLPLSVERSSNSDMSLKPIFSENPLKNFLFNKLSNCFIYTIYIYM